MLKIREVLLAKIETTYGIDPGLTGAANAILVENLAWSHEGARMHERNPIKSSMAPLKPVFGGTLKAISFEVEIKGSGTADVPPELGVLLRGCRFAEATNAGVSVVYAPASGANASLTLHYYQDGVLHVLTGARGKVTFNCETGAPGKASFNFTGHTKMRGTAVSATSTTIVLPSTFSATDDVYNGRTLRITAGIGLGQSKSIADYTGATKTCTVTTWTTTPDSTSIFEIDNGPIDTALATPTYSAIVPVPLIAVPFSVDSYAAVISKLAFDVGLNLVTPPDISSPDGFGELQIIGRKLTGSFDPEAVLVATHDFHGKWKAGNAMALDTGQIGTTAGNRYRIQMPGISYTGVGKGDRDGITVYETPFMAAETGTDNEVSLTFS